MHRDVLLVSSYYLWESSRGTMFHFFHMSSLSAVEVKVKVPSPIDSSVGIPEAPASLEVCLDVVFRWLVS